MVMSWLKEGFYSLLPRKYRALEVEKLEKLKSKWGQLNYCAPELGWFSFSDKCLLYFTFSVSLVYTHTHTLTHWFQFAFVTYYVVNIFPCCEVLSQNINFPGCAVFDLVARQGRQYMVQCWRVWALEPDCLGVNQLLYLPAVGPSFSSCASVFFCKMRIAIPQEFMWELNVLINI